MEESLLCPICGEKTRVYMGKARKDRLCGTHADKYKAGEIIQCEDCQAWISRGAVCSCKGEYTITPWTRENNKTDYPKCVICGADSNGKPQCKDCYYVTKEHMDGLDKNSDSGKLRDHYYNLKNNIYYMNAYDKVQNVCNRLIAIALLNERINGDRSLSDRVYKDSAYYIEKKKPKEKAEPISIKQQKENEKQDQHAQEVYRTTDGHRVKSEPEQRIDDDLYEMRIPHSYNQYVYEIEERSVYCDWFIPVKSTAAGIYIEYWGMNTPQYIENREEKISLYKKHNLPLIEIQKDDIKDSQYKHRLKQEISKMEKEFFK